MSKTVTDGERLERTLALTRAEFGAPLAARERLRGELSARGCFGRAETAAAALAAQRQPAASSGGVTKPVAGLLAGLTFLAGLWLGARGTHEGSLVASPLQPAAPPLEAQPGAASSLAPRAQSEAAATPQAPMEMAAASAALQPRAARRGAAAARAERRPEQRPSTLSAELALLQRAERALRAGEPALALSFLAELEREYPETRLGEERRAARLMAHCARGDVQATAEAERFLQARRASVYSDRVRELCKLQR